MFEPGTLVRLHAEAQYWFASPPIMAALNHANNIGEVIGHHEFCGCTQNAKHHILNIWWPYLGKVQEWNDCNLAKIGT